MFLHDVLNAFLKASHVLLRYLSFLDTFPGLQRPPPDLQRERSTVVYGERLANSHCDDESGGRLLRAVTPFGIQVEDGQGLTRRRIR